MSMVVDGLLIAVGALFLVVGLLDMISTTITPRDGGGFMTRSTLNALWGAWVWLARRLGVHISRGSAPILIMIFAQWLSCLVVGWTAWINALQPSPAFEDCLLSILSLTLGRGRPPLDLPAWMEAGIGLSGVVLVSLTISYIIAVVGAVAYTRHAAVHMLALGPTPDDVLRRAYLDDGTPRQEFVLQLISLTPIIAFLSTKTLAFPVIDVFQPAAPNRAICVRIGCVVKALALVHRDDVREPLPFAAVQTFLEAVDHLLAVYGHVYDESADGGERATMEIRLENLERWVKQSGWSWPDDVYRDQDFQDDSE